MAVNSTEEGCDEYSVVILSDECESCQVPAPANVLKSQLSLDARLTSQSYINTMLENAVACTIDVDLDNAKSDTQTNQGNLKNEQVLMKSLQKQISFDMGGKYMQLLMNHSLMLSKFSTRGGEKLVDGGRCRKYKRVGVAPSFSSRKVVLLFSVLSSLGTMILIYLTLRVRQINDASIHSG